MPKGIRVVVVVVVVVVELGGNVAVVGFLDLFFQESDGVDCCGEGAKVFPADTVEHAGDLLKGALSVVGEDVGLNGAVVFVGLWAVGAWSNGDVAGGIRDEVVEGEHGFVGRGVGVEVAPSLDGSGDLVGVEVVVASPRGG